MRPANSLHSYGAVQLAAASGPTSLPTTPRNIDRSAKDTFSPLRFGENWNLDPKDKFFPQKKLQLLLQEFRRSHFHLKTGYSNLFIPLERHPITLALMDKRTLDADYYETIIHQISGLKSYVKYYMRTFEHNADPHREELDPANELLHFQTEENIQKLFYEAIPNLIRKTQSTAQWQRAFESTTLKLLESGGKYDLFPYELHKTMLNMDKLSRILTSNRPQFIETFERLLDYNPAHINLIHSFPMDPDSYAPPSEARWAGFNKTLTLIEKDYLPVNITAPGKLLRKVGRIFTGDNAYKLSRESKLKQLIDYVSMRVSDKAWLQENEALNVAIMQGKNPFKELKTITERLNRRHY